MAYTCTALREVITQPQYQMGQGIFYIEKALNTATPYINELKSSLLNSHVVKTIEEEAERVLKVYFGAVVQITQAQYGIGSAFNMIRKLTDRIPEVGVISALTGFYIYLGNRAFESMPQPIQNAVDLTSITTSILNDYVLSFLSSSSSMVLKTAQVTKKVIFLPLSKGGTIAFKSLKLSAKASMQIALKALSLLKSKAFLVPTITYITAQHIYDTFCQSHEENIQKDNYDQLPIGFEDGLELGYQHAKGVKQYGFCPAFYLNGTKVK